MPGKPHSSNPAQQKPYVIQKIDKHTAVDNQGNGVSPTSPAAHIPLDEYIYQQEVVYATK